MTVAGKLAALADGYSKGNSTKALGVLLRVHSCIYRRVRGNPVSSTEILALNDLFAEKCIKASQEFITRVISIRPTNLWDVAFVFCRNHPNLHLFCIAWMLNAHILEDLPDALLEQDRNGSPVDKKDYDKVFGDIEYCVKQEGEELFNRWLEKFLMRFGASNIVMQTIVAMREMAWNVYQSRRERRRETREPQKMTVWFRLPLSPKTPEQSGETDNVSPHGAYFSTDYRDLQIGTKVEMFHEAPTVLPIHCIASVVRIELQGGRAGVGVHIE